mmetsp:Transcript_33255/g.75771  ORF Transcript_33255/g.75771 Transcript_33255/m.75771 type:complete len:410 (-) Transcript_33255:32-1261(-)
MVRRRPQSLAAPPGPAAALPKKKAAGNASVVNLRIPALPVPSLDQEGEAGGRRAHEQMRECTNDLISPRKGREARELTSREDCDYVYLDPLDGSEITWREAETLGVSGSLRSARALPTFTTGGSSASTSNRRMRRQDSRAMLPPPVQISEGRRMHEQMRECMNDHNSPRALKAAAPAIAAKKKERVLVYLDPVDGSEISWREAETLGVAATYRDELGEDDVLTHAATEDSSQESAQDEVDFAIGDLVTLKSSWGVPREFHNKVAIINELKPECCTVYMVNEDCSQGLAELWPMYHDLQLISRLCRVGSKVVCSGIGAGPGAYLNELPATVQEHPRDGHPQWPETKGQSQKGGRLFVFVVPDDKKKRPMSVPIRYLRSADAAVTGEAHPKEVDWHVTELLRIASAVTSVT